VPAKGLLAKERFFALALVACATLVACSRRDAASSRGRALRVAAAADLALAFEEIGRDFEKATGQRADFTFGSTGLLARQVEAGAPFDVFAAANVANVDDVVRAGACDGATKQLYAEGRIVLWSKEKGTLPGGLEGLAEARFRKIALANPEHAPYGRAAQEALEKAGVWGKVSSRAVYGDNVQQTMMFAQTGNVDVAIVALSLATRAGGEMLAIDPALHAPLHQAMVTCGRAGRTRRDEARAFVEYVSSPPGRATMRRFGFLLPGEPL
jgi:molybdate transport system substrate-binding protein